MAEPRYPYGGTGLLPSRLTVTGNSNWGATGAFPTGMERSQSNNYLQQPSRMRPTNVSRRTLESDTDVNLNAMIDDNEVFPHDMLLLLTEEARNIKNFKAKIQREKQKVVTDFEVFKKQISHIIDDLKISMVAELDLVYKVFIEKYAMMKSELMEIRRLKKQIQSQSIVQSDISKLIMVQHNVSNFDMVKELEEDALSMRNYKVNNYINTLQKRKLSPLHDLAHDLVVLSTSPAQFYDANTTNVQLGELKQNFSHFTKHMFNALNEFVRSPSIMVEMAKGTTANNEAILKQIEFSKVSERVPAQAPIQPTREVSSISLHKKRKEFSISQSEQILETDWAEDVMMRHVNTIAPEHTDSILCGIVINNKFLVSGGKDGLLVVQTLDGEKVVTLRGHEAGICTLSLIQDNGTIYLASGSDHGCNSIIIWDTNNWSIRAKIKAHSAAVTSIVDLCDGQTLVSGSYDKKINVYNYKKSALLFSLPNNKSSVTSMLLNSARNKLVSCGFDSMMFVWGITRDQTGVVESISIERVIRNDSIVCCLNGSMLRPDIIVAGTKDGKIKFWNLDTGELEKTLSASSNLVIDMVLIERKAKPNHPLIVSCSSRDRFLTLTRSDTQTNTQLDVGGRNYIEFGCGISPKIMFARYGNTPVIGLVNQSGERREINMFEIELK